MPPYLRATGATALAALLLAACTSAPPTHAAGSTTRPARSAVAGVASTAAPRSAAEVPVRRASVETSSVAPIVIPAADRTLAAAHHFRLISTLYWSPALGQKRRVIVMLPEVYYHHLTTRFPVVEFLHGHPGGPLDLFTPLKGDLEGTSDGRGIGAFIAVAPDGNGPLIDDSWWADIPGQAMGTAVTRDLRRWTAAHFRSSSRWSYSGLSTGGYGAAYLPTLDRLPVYGECGLSGFYDSSMPPIPQNYTATQRIPYTPEAHAADAPPKVFLVYGTLDVRTRAQTLAYVRALRRSGRPYVLRTYLGDHQWRVWRPGFADCLRIVVPAA